MSLYSEYNRSVLVHHGVKGMKWGVRKAISLARTRGLNRSLDKAEKRYNKYYDEYKKQSSKSNKSELDRMNEAALFNRAAVQGKRVVQLNEKVRRIMDKNYDLMKKSGSNKNQLDTYKNLIEIQDLLKKSWSIKINKEMTI